MRQHYSDRNAEILQLHASVRRLPHIAGEFNMTPGHVREITALWGGHVSSRVLARPSDAPRREPLNRERVLQRRCHWRLMRLSHHLMFRKAS
jgi:hypothetical protein